VDGQNSDELANRPAQPVHVGKRARNQQKAEGRNPAFRVLKSANQTYKIKKKTRAKVMVKKVPANITLFFCKICPASFESRQAQGGHASKAHPGMSEVYNRKKAIRDRRELYRECLVKAKAEFVNTTQRDPKKFRARVTKLATEIFERTKKTNNV
jgi:hypothetical protein